MLIARSSPEWRLYMDLHVCSCGEAGSRRSTCCASPTRARCWPSTKGFADAVSCRSPRGHRNVRGPRQACNRCPRRRRASRPQEVYVGGPDGLDKHARHFQRVLDVRLAGRAGLVAVPRFGESRCPVQRRQIGFRQTVHPPGAKGGPAFLRLEGLHEEACLVSVDELLTATTHCRIDQPTVAFSINDLTGDAPGDIFAAGLDRVAEPRDRRPRSRAHRATARSGARLPCQRFRS